MKQMQSGLRIFATGTCPASAAKLSIGKAALVGLSAAAIYVLRSIPLTDSVWAEDASIFVSRAYSDPLGSLFKPFNGYLNVLPTLVSMPMRLFPIGTAPVVIILTTGLIYGAVSGLSARVASYFLDSSWFAAAIGVSTVLVPVLGQEAIASLANLQFILIYSVFWLVLIPVSKPWIAGALGAYGVLVALSTPLALILVPLAIVVAWRSQMSKRFLALGLAVGSLTQVILWAAGASGDRLSTGESLPASVAKGVERLFASLAAHDLTDPSSLGRFIAGAVIALLIGASLILLAHAHQSERGGVTRTLALALGFVAFLYAVGFVVFASALNRGTPDRYLVTPGLLLIVALISCTDCAFRDAHVSKRMMSRVAVLPLVAVIVCLIVAMAVDCGVGTWRRSTAPWRAAVADARRTCETREGNARIDAGGFPWAIAVVPCEDL